MSTAPERWFVVELRFAAERRPDEDARARLGDLLVEAGGAGVEERDDALVTYLPEPDDPAAVVDRVRDAVETLERGPDAAPVTIHHRWQVHEDWAEHWKRGLGPRRITDRIVVAPSWTEPELRPGDLLITLDPGMAFGTAEHGTTRGCLRLLDVAVRPGDRVLDVGAGSGILSIAAVLLGAEKALALEMDGWAAAAARENAAMNGVGDRVEVREIRVDAQELPGLGPREGVVANLETGLLVPLLPGLAAVPGTEWLMLSGILEDEWPRVHGLAQGAGFRTDRVDEDGEWISALLRPER